MPAEGPHSPVFSALQWVVLAAGGERGSANAAAPMAFAALQVPARHAEKGRETD